MKRAELFFNILVLVFGIPGTIILYSEGIKNSSEVTYLGWVGFILLACTIVSYWYARKLEKENSL